MRYSAIFFFFWSFFSFQFFFVHFSLSFFLVLVISSSFPAVFFPSLCTSRFQGVVLHIMCFLMAHARLSHFCWGCLRFVSCSLSSVPTTNETSTVFEDFSQIVLAFYILLLEYSLDIANCLWLKLPSTVLCSCLLSCDADWWCSRIPTFRCAMLHPSSWWGVWSQGFCNSSSLQNVVDISREHRYLTPLLFNWSSLLANVSVCVIISFFVLSFHVTIDDELFSAVYIWRSVTFCT